MAKKAKKAAAPRAAGKPARTRSAGDTVAFYDAKLAPRAEKTDANTLQMSIRPPKETPRLGFTLAQSVTRAQRPVKPSK